MPKNNFQMDSKWIPDRFVVFFDHLFDNGPMEELIRTLEKLNISEGTIAMIRDAGDCKEARAYATMLIAMYDDRHEYV